MKETTIAEVVRDLMRGNAFKIREAFDAALFAARVVDHHTTPSDMVWMDQVRGISFTFCAPDLPVWNPLDDPSYQITYTAHASLYVPVFYGGQLYFVFVASKPEDAAITIDFLHRLDQQNVIGLYQVREDGTLGLPPQSNTGFYVYDESTLAFDGYPFRVPIPRREGQPNRYISREKLMYIILESKREARSLVEFYKIN